VDGTMHVEAVDRASHRIGRSPVALLLAVVVVLVIAIALAAGPAASAARAPAGTPTAVPTVCTADGVSGPCS